MIIRQYVDSLNAYVQNEIVLALLVLLVFIILAKIVQVGIDKILIHFVRKTQTNFDDLIIEKTKRPLFYLILFLGLRFSLRLLNKNSIAEKSMESLVLIAFIYILAVVVKITIYSWGSSLAKNTNTKIDETLIPLLQKAASILFFIITAISVFHVWQIDVTPYLAGLGLGGLVLGLALQDSLKNVFGGVSLILDGSLHIGDKIKIESGDTGEITEIGLRSTRLKTYDNEIIFIPNGQMANMRIHNSALPDPKVRVIVNFGVEYGTGINKVQAVVLEAIDSIEGVSKEPYRDVVFTEMGDYALKFQARFFVDDYRVAYDKKLVATARIYDALNKAKIKIPFPTQKVHSIKSK